MFRHKTYFPTRSLWEPVEFMSCASSCLTPDAIFLPIRMQSWGPRPKYYRSFYVIDYIVRKRQRSKYRWVHLDRYDEAVWGLAYDFDSIIKSERLREIMKSLRERIH